MPGDVDRSRVMVARALLWLCAAAILYAAALAITGGFTADVAGVRISSRSALRPILLGLALGLAAAAMLRRDVRVIRFALLDAAVHRYALIGAAAAAGAIGITCYVAGVHVAFGADASGYLSQARLWRAGELRVATPLALDATAAHGQHAFTPLGYRPSDTPGIVVPSYPPGLPLHFAAAAALAGEQAQFAIPPLSAAGITIIAFLLGRRIGGNETAIIAAAACATSPMLIIQAMQAMSDAPAAFWWSLAVLLLTYDSLLGAAIAGVAAGVACAVRPNLFVMVPLLLMLAAWWQATPLRTPFGEASRRGLVRPIGRGMAFLAGPAVAAMAIAWLHQTLYGDAATSGYGRFGDLFSLDHVRPNLDRYPRWAIQVQSALIAIPIAAPFVIRRGWVRPRLNQDRATRLAWSALLFTAALQAFYLAYLVLDDWFSFRFLLPALPWLLVMQAAVLAAVCRAAPRPLRSLVVIVTTLLIASWGVDRARDLGAFRLQQGEQRYLEVAGFARTLPTDAVFITVHHSGSLPYYAQAAVVRWDWLEPEEIDRVVAELHGRRRRVLVVLDDFEEPQFRRRFAASRTAAQLDTPVFTGGGRVGITSRVYALTE